MFIKKLWYKFKQDWLKLLAAVLTVTWLLVLLFPLYWLLISSTKDASEAMRNPPRLTVVLPKDYTIYLDTTDVEDYDEDDFKYEALVLQWMLSARNYSINLNSITVARVENNKVLSTATLKYVTYRDVEEDIILVEYFASVSLKPCAGDAGDRAESARDRPCKRRTAPHLLACDKG